MFPNRHPSGTLKSITLEARCKATTESCTQLSKHMNAFITTGNPLNTKYWINIQQLCWCFLHFGSELSPPCRMLAEQATTLSQEKTQNGGLRLRYARLATRGQREREQHNWTTGWEMRLLLLFSLREIRLQLFPYTAGPGKNRCLSCDQPRPPLSLPSLHAPQQEPRSLWDQDWFSCVQGALPHVCLTFCPYAPSREHFSEQENWILVSAPQRCKRHRLVPPPCLEASGLRGSAPLTAACRWGRRCAWDQTCPRRGMLQHHGH